MTCQEVDDLAAPYALGALVREERVQLEAHLETCSKHAAVLEQYRGTVGFLHMTTVDTEPPASLKTGILSAIRSEEEALEATRRADSATRESIPATLMETHPRSRAAGTMRRRLAWPTAISMPWPGLALPAVVLLSLLAWNLSLQFSDDSPVLFHATCRTKQRASTGKSTLSRMSVLSRLRVCRSFKRAKAIRPGPS